MTNKTALLAMALTGALTVPASLAAALGFTGASPGLQQTAEPLRPVNPQAPGAPLVPPLAPLGEEAEDAVGGVDTLDLEEAIRDDLAQVDLDAREEAFDRWSGEAAASAEVEQALRAIQGDVSDPDAAFLARLALRRAGGPRVGGRRLAPGRLFPGRSRIGMGTVDPFRSIEEMQRRMDEVFGSDPFFGGVFGGDPFLRGGSSLRPRPGGVDLQRRIEEMQRELDELLGQGAFGVGPRGKRQPGQPQAGGQIHGRSSSIAIQTGPSGVRVEITDEGPDGAETNTYEAPSMDELLEAHPELRGRLR